MEKLNQPSQTQQGNKPGQPNQMPPKPGQPNQQTGSGQHADSGNKK